MGSNLFWRNNEKQSWMEMSEWFIGQMRLNFSGSYSTNTESTAQHEVVNRKMECWQTGDELCPFYDWHSPLRSSWVSSIFISVTKALWPAGIWMNLSFCLHTNCSLTHIEPFFLSAGITFTIMSTDILLKSQQSISNQRGPSLFTWSSLWAPFLLKCLDLQWHEKSAGEADGNLSCPLDTASQLGHAT